MGFFIRLVILFATAVLVALSARFNPGNVVLFYPPYRIDMSLNLFILVLLVIFALLGLLFYTINATKQMPERVATYRRSKSEREGNKALRDALKAFFEGRFGHAEKAAMRAAELPENTALASLIGARAAHNMSQSERRDAWLAGIEDNQQYKVARLVSTTELLVDAHQSEQALEAVKELNANGTRHIHVLRWALKANQQAKQWTEVLRLVKALDKHRSLHPALSTRLRELAYQDLLSDHGQDAESIRRLWYSIPAEDRVKPFVAALAARTMVAQGLFDEARNLLEKALLVDWDERLIVAYREAAAKEGSAALLTQIEHCESWLVIHPTDPELALTMGVLCLNQKLWGKAERNLEQALMYASDITCLRETNLKLAQLNEQLGLQEKAAEYYRACALIAERKFT
ncbi:heme biosynthesis protein HemY [Solimicrobium silvestre]|uniref:Heme biosynthesis-associated TPR protein n=1 Tax=Solimicrobium silvestre TaxID=2099400 RepID=A0A2S9GU83_9BURK|nr:heme biosynthesis protein HemY [Solimicrobium silvestre]PRC91270.1 Heme biosynthesis-associated TPR protein [Solimicrobium silvestre]